LTGTDPRAWGAQHGEAFASEIRELAAIRSDLLATALRGWTTAQVERLCDDHLHTLATRYPATLAELEGIGAGSGTSLRELIILNGYTDLRDFSASDRPAVEDGCSAMAIKGPHINFAAQTWDMHASAEPFTLLLDLPNATVPARVLTLTGCLGLCGVNAAGVSVMINNFHCRQTNRGGIVWPGLVRQMLDQRTAHAAVATLKANLPSSGHNYLVSDRDEAFNIETTGLRHEQTGHVAREMVAAIGHTNHFVGALNSEEIVARRSTSTDARLAALDAFFADHPAAEVTGTVARAAFFEAGALCDCVCFPKPQDPAAACTCGGIAVDYATGTAMAFRGLYDKAHAIEWRF
jgi:isopenicillin-N N-acyltransferase-like protein